MKTMNFTVLFLFVFLFMASWETSAQTRQFNMHAVCDEAMLACMPEGNTISGEFTYHVTYHLDKTGKVEWLHWNVLNTDLKNDATGEEYILIDTGHDNMNFGGSWIFWNNAHAFNEAYGVYYDRTDGTLNLPDEFPSEGTAVYSSFKLKTKAGADIGVGHTVIQLHMNSCGELTADVEKSYFTCY